jgi:4-diphosphocytidyl-2-C-methyl-D-erythritol kinase
VIVFPNAKINIGLFVTAKRSDGFHNIKSLFYPVPFTDVLEITPAESFSFSKSGLIIPEGNNLVVEAFELMKSRYNIEDVFIHLHKRIPMGSGLGGGSSNAAFTLMTLNLLFELNLSTNELEELALELGSDCPFFIRNKPAYAEGRGEDLQIHDIDLGGQFIKIIHNEIHVSTPMAFKLINPIEREFPIDFTNNSSAFINDFEPAVFGMHPQLNVIKEKMIKEGAFYVSMSGSGSAIFGLYRNKPNKSGSYCTEEILELK